VAFIGATQLLVYVGGTLVLVVFGVMLTAQGPFINMKVNAAEWAIGLGVGLLLYGVLAFVMVNVTREGTLGLSEEHDPIPSSLTPSKHLGLTLLGERRAAGAEAMSGSKEARRRPRTRVSYLLPFEIVSVHLLVVLIGAAYLARAKRRRAAATASTPPVAPAPVVNGATATTTAPVNGIGQH
jgi:NADH-quinone oxidoreductase subunit J